MEKEKLIDRMRFIEKGHGNDSLTDHEIFELSRDYDLPVNNDKYHVIICLTKYEFEKIMKLNETEEKQYCKPKFKNIDLSKIPKEYIGDIDYIKTQKYGGIRCID